METPDLIKALIAFRSNAPIVKFDSTNPHFKSRFASLAAIHKTVNPLLAEHGLAVVQFPISDESGIGCITRIIHESGQTMEERFTVPTTKSDPQRACAAV